MELREKLALAERTARAAGALLLSTRDFKVEQKAAHDFVTEMDMASERLIREALLSACPEDGFFGEETGKTAGSGGVWIVDPIDGTTNFIRGIPIYTISIGYQQHGELLLGAVYCPLLDEMFLGMKGQGATLNGQPIHTSNVSAAGDAIVGISFAHRNEDNKKRMAKVLQLFNELDDVRRLGSAAYDLCCVAMGRFEAFVELGLNLYDIAAGVVILHEAGGRATGWPGEADCTVTGNVLAGNGTINGYLASRILLSEKAQDPAARG